MKPPSNFVVCSLWVLLFSALDISDRVTASERMPDASLIAYRARRPNLNAANPPLKYFDVALTGVIDAFRANGLMIKAGKTSRAKDQKEWLAIVQSGRTEITIHAVATLDYVRHGQTVEFNGRIVTHETDKGKEEKVAERVKELTIVARKAGASVTKNAAAKDTTVHATDPGITDDRIKAPKSDTEAESTLTPPDDSQAVNGDKNDALAGGPQAKIVGRIESHDDKSLTVTCGQRTIHVDLAEIPTINVELFDARVTPDSSKDPAKSKIEGTGISGRLVPMDASDLIGAKIVVRGLGAESKSGNQCLAKTIVVTLAKPLVGKKSISSARKPTTPNEQ
jgi:hypothetical protein